MLTKESLPILNLQTGTWRVDNFIHHGGWYNSRGEEIGWGDLSKADVRRILTLLDEGEVFLVIPETSITKEHNPGVDYVAEHAYWVITKHGIFHKAKHGPNTDGEYNGVQYRAITTEQIKQLLQQGR